ncbi:hypothetical protein DV737_g1194, partial [Chaetothyriales sp. CBS 132003]
MRLLAGVTSPKWRYRNMTILHWAMENGLKTAKTMIEVLNIRDDPERDEKYLYKDRDGIEYSPQQYAWRLFEMESVSLSQLDGFGGGGSETLDLVGHAMSGSIAASVSNAVTYPLDLIITRLQVQQRPKREGETGDLGDVREVMTSVYRDEGGMSGFYAGVQQDTARAMADSVLFFLLYSLLRERRAQRKLALRADGSSSSSSSVGKSLGAVDEMAVGFVAAALTQAATTPLANVVTRKQTAGPDADKLSTRETMEQIRREKGLAGLWSGYSASLVLALKPSLTLAVFEALKRVLLPQSRARDVPPALTVVLVALSKAIAASVTYPFGVARSRLQADNVKANSAFTVLRRISEQEGWQSLYSGVGLEASKEFFSHGITLLAKQGIQKALLQLHGIFSIMLGRYRSQVDGQRMGEGAGEKMENYNLSLERAADKIEQGIDAMQSRANETAEFIGEYVEEESANWKEL